jgi:hypothetical protein
MYIYLKKINLFLQMYSGIQRLSSSFPPAGIETSTLLKLSEFSHKIEIFRKALKLKYLLFLCELIVFQFNVSLFFKK